VRKAFNFSSNAFLEVQWYLFAAVFLLASGYTLMRNEHVRIDVISGRFTKRTQIIIDVIGICFFLFPFVIVVFGLVMPLAIRAYVTGEMSSNAGGLIRWPMVRDAAARACVAGHPGRVGTHQALRVPAGPDP
jgi:TRAP-type mannitol/chloroaromatic compound transport system permease small subunit